jgi:hypothetical protein
MFDHLASNDKNSCEKWIWNNAESSWPNSVTCLGRLQKITITCSKEIQSPVLQPTNKYEDKCLPTPPPPTHKQRRTSANMTLTRSQRPSVCEIQPLWVETPRHPSKRSPPPPQTT